MQDIANILDLASVCQYDFRRTAHAGDPLKHLFQRLGRLLPNEMGDRAP